MKLTYVTPEIDLTYISPDEAPDNDSGTPYRPLQVHGSQDTSWNRCDYISHRHSRPKTPRLRVPPSSKSVYIRVNPWFLFSFSSPTVSHFSLITDHSALPPTPASDHTCELLYKAQLSNEETGFYSYGNRYLSPMLGRWISRDPIGKRGELNLYGFVENNGMDAQDAYGDSWDSVADYLDRP